MARQQSNTTDNPDTPSSPALAPPIFLVGLGPQNSGKSTLLRAIIYRAREQGRDPLICDGDRNDAYLTGMFSLPSDDGAMQGVSRPRYGDDATVIEWLDNEVSAMDQTRRSICLDMGGGDLVLPTYARDRELVPMLIGAGIRPVALHMVLPNPSDLTVLEQMEGGDLFAPADTVLALNAGPLADTRPADVIFRHVRQTEVYRRALSRGAREILMPTLTCMSEIDAKGLTFAQAASRPSPLGLSKGQMAVTFQRKLYAELDKVSEALP